MDQQQGPPLPGIDRQVVQIPGHPAPLTIGDDGHPAHPGQYVIEDRTTRRRRRILVLAGQGYAYENIRAKVCREFHCTPPTFQKDMEHIGSIARRINDDEDFMDLVVGDAIQKVRRLVARAFADANVHIDPTTIVDEKTLTELFKARLAASKEVRAGAETLVGLFGRRSRRWSPKQSIEVASVQGGTAEQQAAVRRMLGEDETPTPPEHP